MNDSFTQADKDLLHYVAETVQEAIVVAFATSRIESMTEEQKVFVCDTAEKLAAFAIVSKVMDLRPVQPAVLRQQVVFSNN